jgi:phage protein U
MGALKRSRSGRWLEQEVLDVEPRLSYTGPGGVTITLDGVVYPGQLGEADAVERLEALADLAKPFALTDSEGRSYGRWVITQIDQDQSNHQPGGTPRRIAWSMQLRRFPEDQPDA